MNIDWSAYNWIEEDELENCRTVRIQIRRQLVKPMGLGWHYDKRNRNGPNLSNSLPDTGASNPFNTLPGSIIKPDLKAVINSIPCKNIGNKTIVVSSREK